MAKRNYPATESVSLPADILAAERDRVRDIQAQGAARVMERVRESQRFTGTRVQDSLRPARGRMGRYAAALATGLAAGLLVLVSLESWTPVPQPEVIVSEAKPNARTARLATAQNSHVLESAIDRAHPSSTLLVPAGTRLDAADAPIRITKPLRIDTPS